MLNMNGYEFEFDLFDFETAQKYEAALDKTVKKLDEDKENERLSESIKMQCDTVRDCIDDIFGNGQGIRVCGERYNLTNHLNAFESLVEEALRQRAEHDERAKKYMFPQQNRAKRRSSKKQFRKN